MLKNKITTQTDQLTHPSKGKAALTHLSKPFRFMALAIGLSVLASPAYAEKIVNTANTKSVGPVVWHKKANIEPNQLINQAIPVGSTSLFFIRPVDNDGFQTSVNIAVNDRFQVSLQPGNYTQVYSCAGSNQISAVITGKKSNNLTQDAHLFDLPANGAYFFYVNVDENGNEVIEQITQQSAEEVLANKTYQDHQISRVVPNCPLVVKAPDPVVPAIVPKVTQSAPVIPKLTEQVNISLKVLFDNNEAVVKPEYYSEVKAVADFMQQYPNTQTVIEGHTDSVGKDSHNQQLSQRRAEAVKQLLTDQFGIDASRLSAIGFGETKPIASNDTQMGREQNRRVVAVINERVSR
ncbi:MAG: OmpA family protein [Psychrobacter sp.]|nr:OmpA family protein [Psychrobacter sp.]